MEQRQKSAEVEICKQQPLYLHAHRHGETRAFHYGTSAIVLLEFSDRSRRRLTWQQFTYLLLSSQRILKS